MTNFSAASLAQICLSLVFMCWTAGSTGAPISLESLEEEFLLLKENYIQMKEIVKSLESKVIELQADRSAVAINGLPSSCGDLKMIGHTLNGFYSVMGSAMMESVYCDFTKLPSDAGFQKWIGYVDVKSAPVHFYVQRESKFNTTKTPIPFELEIVNEGSAMDVMSGIFTAPRPGLYFFSFTGLANFPASTTFENLEVHLYLNGVRIGASAAEDGNSASKQWSQLSLQSSLNLKKDDQVWLEINFMTAGVDLFDMSYHYTHFTGFMLQEEIVASL